MHNSGLSLLIKETEDIGIYSLQSGVFPENKASLNLLRKSAFIGIGFRKKIGKLNGTWRDTVLL